MCRLKNSGCLIDMVFAGNNIQIDALTTKIEVKKDDLTGFDY